ncbi:MAG: flagellar hook-associated protein 2, partial [Clostridia bacterium]|nr:flagellar hook-associated protein 2 [Clostridia bacterium]
MADLRVGGLATGMDIESIVKDLMKAERIPLDKLKQDKQLLEWKQDDYREINKALFDFRDKVFDLKLQGTFNVKNATSSNEDAVEVSAGGNVTDGIYTLDIKQMARGVNKASASELNDEVDADGNTLALADQFNSLSGTLSFILKGWKDGAETTEDFSFDTSTDNIYDVVNEINSRDMGITASYDSKLNRFFLTTPTGQNSKIQVTSDSSNFLSYASGGSSADTVLKLDIEENIAYNGVDAEVDFGGGQFSFADNKFTINGINFTLKDEPADPASPITVNVNVTNDTDAVFNKIKDFVESYND